MRRYCFALDLKNDKKLIKNYIEHHKNVWPEVIESFNNLGIVEVSLYNIENRLFMIINCNSNFSIENKKKRDLKNSKVKKWEELMNNFQKLIPNTPKGEKWRLMDKIFSVSPIE